MRTRITLTATVLGLCLVLSSCALVDVLAIAGDGYGGRNNGTPGSTMTQAYLLDQLRPIAIGANTAATGDAAYLQPIALGTNVVAMIPGTDLADQYVIVGAHYDHLGNGCPTSVPGDTICNGATDNAAGVAAALTIARTIAKAPTRRTVVIAFWDREEDGLLGSGEYLTHPLVPVAKTVAYVNFDIQGSNLLPSLRSTTFAIGAETGGAALQSAVAAGAATTTLQTAMLSAPFGQYRSDYARFLNAHIPSVFYTDSNGPCYHTAQDAPSIVDFTKLGQQIASATALTESLANTSTPPTYVAGTPLATFDDAAGLAAIVERALPDLSRFSPADQTALLKVRTDLTAIVTAGPAQFGPEDVSPVLSAAISASGILTHGPCDGFLPAPTTTAGG